MRGGARRSISTSGSRPRRPGRTLPDSRAAVMRRHMDIPGIQALWAAAGGWQTALLLLSGAGLGLTALGLRWLRQRMRRRTRRRSPGQPAPRRPPAGGRGRASRPAPPAPSAAAGGRQTAAGTVPAARAGGEFTGLLAPGRPWSAWQWDVYRQLQAGLNSGEYCPGAGARRASISIPRCRWGRCWAGRLPGSATRSDSGGCTR